MKLWLQGLLFNIPAMLTAYNAHSILIVRKWYASEFKQLRYNECSRNIVCKSIFTIGYSLTSIYLLEYYGTLNTILMEWNETYIRTYNHMLVLLYTTKLIRPSYLRYCKTTYLRWQLRSSEFPQCTRISDKCLSEKHCHMNIRIIYFDIRSKYVLIVCYIIFKCIYK